jgi:hypothetical protein
MGQTPAIKPICERLGVDWEGQRQRIQRDPVLAKGTCVIKVPSAQGLQDTVALSLFKLHVNLQQRANRQHADIFGSQTLLVFADLLPVPEIARQTGDLLGAPLQQDRGAVEELQRRGADQRGTGRVDPQIGDQRLGEPLDRE